jgi:hypothetical protein
MLGLGSVATLFIDKKSEPGATVCILMQERKIGSLSILKDTVITVSGSIGKTEIRIENGRVWISNAPCANRICQHQGKISRNGQMLVCVPNRIIVQIEGQKQNDIDACTM